MKENAPDRMTQLALRRTLYALERTQLAWVRTAFAFIGVGVTLSQATVALESAELLANPRWLTAAQTGGTVLSLSAAGLLFIATRAYRHDHTALAADDVPHRWSLATLLASYGVILLGVAASILVNVMS